MTDNLRDASDMTPEMLLEMALREVRSGEEECNKMVIVTLNTMEDSFRVGYYNAGCKASEAALACEIAKIRFLNAMGQVAIPGRGGVPGEEDD